MKTHKIIRSFNAGELSPLMDARSDQDKYHFGCRTLENFYPLIYGAAERRQGTEYIAGCKSNDAASRLVPFEHSVDDTYILEFANQVIRVFRDGGRVLTNTGTEDISALNNIVAHWLMNDNLATTAVLDNDGNDHDLILTTNTETVHYTGKTGTGCFNLGGSYYAYRTDHDDFSFIEGTNGDFSIAGWVYVTTAGEEQVIISKWTDTVGSEGREWKLVLDGSRKLKMCLADESLLLDSDLISHWKLNDNASSNTVLDAQGSHNGSLTGGDNNYTSELHATGKVGTGCFDFDGSDDVVVVTDHNDFTFGNGAADSAFSISAWINMDDATSFPILTKDAAGHREWRFTVNSDDKLTFSCLDDSEGSYIGRRYNTAITAQEGSWIHVVATYDATEASSGITLYLNGSAVDDTNAQDGAYTAMENTGSHVRIACDAFGDNYANGEIDNVMLFNKELSAAEVTALYNSGSGIEELNTVYPYKTSDDALDTGWRFVAMTYEGENGAWTGATAANYITLYVDGAAVDATATNLSTYSKMENTSGRIRVGATYDAAAENVWADKIDNLFVTSDKLSAAEIAALITSSATYEVTTPYLTADIPYLKFEHSADVMYITHPDYEPRKLSRTGHDVWSLEAMDYQSGPFRSENTDTSATIAADGTTGSVTLTASGCSPFVAGTTAGHLPSGALETSKSQTGALFRLIHALGTSDISDQLQADVLNDATSTLNVYKGITWDFVSNGTWGGSNDPATIVLERSYDSGTTYETVVTVTSAGNHNVETSGTEESADAIYRARVSSACAADTEATVQISVRDTSHIGVVEITAVASPTSATATVLTTLGSTNATHRWSEGAWSNYRGWPIVSRISPEERLVFAGNASQPLNVWGSVVGDFTDMEEGSLDDDAYVFTLVGTGQQNRIRWMLPKSALMIGTNGGEHLLGATDDKEAVTPTNETARIQGTNGSEDVDAIIVNQAILFLERGARKVREFVYNFEEDAHEAEDLTVYAHHITDSGIKYMAFQRTPDPMLWCVREDGEMAVLSYERKQNVYGWSRIVTRSGDEFESVAVIYGGAGSEDEVWVTVKRDVNGSDVRYIERFHSRDWGDDIEDAVFVDSSLTYDSTATSTITGLSHLEGETVAVFADGAVFDNATVSSGQITLKDATVTTTASTVQVGLPYTSTLKPMKLDLAQLGLATTKKINRIVISCYNTIGGVVGRDTTNTDPIKSDWTDLETDDYEVPFNSRYSRSGDIVVMQEDPAPMTVVAITMDVGASND